MFEYRIPNNKVKKWMAAGKPFKFRTKFALWADDIGADIQIVLRHSDDKKRCWFVIQFPNLRTARLFACRFYGA